MSRPSIAARLVIVIALAGAAAAARSATEAEEMNQLASDRGCARCHSLLPPLAGSRILPAGPAWADIAARYRGQPDAENRLVLVVLRGSGAQDRHWSGKTRATKMPANLIEISEDEAHRLVRWVLKQDRGKVKSR